MKYVDSSSGQNKEYARSNDPSGKFIEITSYRKYLNKMEGDHTAQRGWPLQRERIHVLNDDDA